MCDDSRIFYVYNLHRFLTLEIPRATRATFLAPAEGCSFGPSALTSGGWEQFLRLNQFGLKIGSKIASMEKYFKSPRKEIFQADTLENPSVLFSGTINRLFEPGRNL